tara:strand:- start:938 stop:1267 length:330 start_codon:yes stop_codon:yes gene_type:complete
MRKLVEYAVLFVLGALSTAGLLFLSYPTEPVNTTNKWFKVATDEAKSGEIVILDMNRGYSYTNKGLILLVVEDSENKDQIVIAFPDGGYWESPVLNPDLNKSVPWKRTY